MDLNNKQRFGLKPAIALALLLALSVVGLLNIEKNTSPFFLDKSHPARADHIEHQGIFTRAAYSTYVLLRVVEGADIYRNDLVTALQSTHRSIENIALTEFVNHAKLAQQFSVELNAQSLAFSSRDEAIEIYNQLTKTYPRIEVHRLLGQFVFPVKNVKSLINSDNIYEHDDELIIESNFVRRADWDAGTRRFISDNALLRGGLFSEDQQGLLIQVEYAIDDEYTELNTALLGKIKSAVNRSVADIPVIESVHYAGGPVLNTALSEVMEQDNAKYFPLVILFVLATLTAFYRSLRCAVYGLIIAVFSIVCTMALMPVFGITLNIVTTVLPVFIITIAVTDAIHVMSAVRSSADRSNKRAVRTAVKKLIRPMFLTSVTTGVGFLSLSLTEIGNIYGFGIMVAVSVVIAFALSVTLLPHLLRTWPIRQNNGKAANNIADKVSEAFIRIVLERRWPALLCVALTVGIAFVGLPKLEVDQASIEAFDVDTKMRVDNQMFKESGSGSVVLGLWFEGLHEGAMLRSDMLNLMTAIQKRAEQHDYYVDSISLVDFLNHMHTVLEGKYSVPLAYTDSERVRQYLFLLEGGAERDLDSVVTVGDYKQARLAISLKQDNSAAIKDLVAQLDLVLEAGLPEDVSVRYTGYGALVNVASHEVFVSQLNSLLTSFALIYLIFLAVFRSLSTAIVGLIPLLATLTTMFGLMGVFEFSLDIGSSLVAGIAFGIGIDYSIHFIEALRREPLQPSRNRSISRALSQVTLPIGTSAIVLSSGFSLLLLSGFKSLASLGLLVMVSMLVSAVFTLVILPRILLLLPERMYCSIRGRIEISQSSSPIFRVDDEVIILEECMSNSAEQVNRPIPRREVE